MKTPFAILRFVFAASTGFLIGWPANATGQDAASQAAKILDLGPSVTLTMPKVQAAHDEEVDVPIQISGASDLGCLQMALSYDKNLLQVLGVEKGTMLPANAIVEHDAEVPGRLGVGFVTGGSEDRKKLVAINGNGDILRVRFKVLGQPGQISPLTPQKAQAWQIENAELTIQPVEGELVITGSRFPWLYILLAVVALLVAATLGIRRQSKPSLTST